MSYIGDEDDAAPQLHRYRPRDQAEAEELLEQCLHAIERMLFHDVIHGDLSPFNVLVWEGRICVIDLPQAVDPKKNRHAESLLARDVARVCEHFARRGILRGSGGDRRRSLDGVDIRRPRPRGVATAPLATLECRPGAGGYSAPCPGAGSPRS